MAEDTTAPASSIDAMSSEASANAESRSSRSAEDTERLLREAEAALQDVEETLQGPKPTPFKLEELIGQGGPPEKCTMDLLRDVELDLKIELGRTEMFLEDILKLRRGSVVTLDKLAGDPVDIYVNGRLVARGEVLVLNDNFCVRVAELVGSDALAADK